MSSDERRIEAAARGLYEAEWRDPSESDWGDLGPEDQEGYRRVQRTALAPLLVEVERLRADLAAEQAAHAKTASNFEEFAESSIEERDRLRHALDDARRERTRARQAFIELVNGGEAKAALQERTEEETT